METLLRENERGKAAPETPYCVCLSSLTFFLDAIKNLRMSHLGEILGCKLKTVGRYIVAVS